MMKLDRSGTASRFPWILLLIYVDVVCIVHVPVTLKTNLLCSTGLSAVPSILGAPSTVSPLVAPLVQGGFPAVAGLAGLGVNVPAVVDPVGVPSECLLLKNMFDPSTEVGVNISLVCLTFCISQANLSLYMYLSRTD